MGLIAVSELYFHLSLRIDISSLLNHSIASCIEGNCKVGLVDDDKKKKLAILKVL